MTDGDVNVPRHARPRHAAGTEPAAVRPQSGHVRPAGSSEQRKCTRRGTSHGSRQRAATPGFRGESQGARERLPRQDKAPPDAAPSSQIRLGKENQPNLQAKWPLSVESPGLPPAEVSWLARSLPGRKVMWGNVSIWGLTGPYRLWAGTRGLSPSPMERGRAARGCPLGPSSFFCGPRATGWPPASAPPAHPAVHQPPWSGLRILPPIWGTSGLRMRRVLCCQAPSD